MTMPHEPERGTGGAPAAGAVEVRDATVADLPRVWELLLGLAAYERLSSEVTGSLPQLERALFAPRPAVECLVALRGERIIGYALFFTTFSSFRTAPGLWLEDLFVEPESRGAGAGRILLEALARRARERGAIRVDWHVLDWNEPSIRFYEGVGARRVASDWYQYRLDGAALQRLIDSPAR